MDEINPIRVLVVDDHTVVRRGLIFVLQAFSDIQTVGEAGSVNDAVELCRSLEPDVVLMDIKMAGDIDGIIATKEIRERFPTIQVLILSSFHDSDIVTQAIQAGAKGYLLKDVSTEELAQAIRLTHAGKLTLAPEAAQALMGGHQAVDPIGKDLTERQLAVLKLVVKGFTNLEIAQQLNVTSYTARHHVSEILAKLHASNRAEAAVIAIKKGLVEE
jgi:two-component system, NarL family, response regulator LiaR